MHRNTKLSQYQLMSGWVSFIACIPFVILMPLTGKKGIGLGKRARAPSPTSAERVAKMAKMAETTSKEKYRDRARQEYEERRADGRLIPAQRTCATLDEKSGKLVR